MERLSGLPLRRARPGELDALSALCLRSKAYWGYDDAFMAACVDELTLTEPDLERWEVWVHDGDRGPAGVAAVNVDGPDAEVELLFVDPCAMGGGIGRALFETLVARATDRGARTLHIVADPGARPFYERMGARLTGSVPSGSIPGRFLPKLELMLPGVAA